MPRSKPISRSAYELFHAGTQELSRVEANGLRIDEEYLERSIEKLDRKIERTTARLKKSKLWKTWRRRFGEKTKLGSRDQLGHVLFEMMGFKCAETTPTGRPKVDETTLGMVDHPFAKHYLELSKMEKTRGTYLLGIQREMVDGFIHPFFNLATTRTFRGSSDSPNFQNIPIRNPEMGKMIRRCFIPREGRQIVELDYDAVEVRVSACYHKDPRMIKYILDPNADMHRDMTAQIYRMDKRDVTKEQRYCGKNLFVFPQFYGDYYVNCARNLWEAIDRRDLEAPGGGDMKKWLRDQGIDRRGACDGESEAASGTFERHMKEVEHDFWNNRFRVYSNWKDRWWKKYQKRGYFDTLTGFRFEGILNRKNTINYPVQGSAFHLLLWSLIQINRRLRRGKMKSLIIGQIHDSIVMDVDPVELDDVLELAYGVMTEEIKQWAPWLVFPLDVEAEATPVDGTWFDKEVIEIAA